MRPDNALISLEVSHSMLIAVARLVGTVLGVSYSSDLTDEQWTLVESVVNAPGERGRTHAPDIRRRDVRRLPVAVPPCTSRADRGRGRGRSFAPGHAPGTGRDHSRDPPPHARQGTTTSSCAGSGWDERQPMFCPSGTLGASMSPTDASDAPAALRCRWRTRPPRRSAGSRSPTSRPPCGGRAQSALPLAA